MSDPDADLQLTIDGKAYVIDPDDLELWEAEFIEDYCQAPFGAIDFAAFRTIRALTWIVLHRENPNITMDDVGKLKMSSMKIGAVEPEPVDPPTKPAAARPRPKRKPAPKPAGGGGP